MSRPKLPRPGSILMGDDYQFIIVVQRGWSDERIRRAFTDAFGDEVEDLSEVMVDTWRFHTAEQRRSDFGGDGDSYWSPDGQGASSIEVAVISL